MKVPGVIPNVVLVVEVAADDRFIELNINPAHNTTASADTETFLMVVDLMVEYL